MKPVVRKQQRLGILCKRDLYYFFLEGCVDHRDLNRVDRRQRKMCIKKRNKERKEGKGEGGGIKGER